MYVSDPYDELASGLGNLAELLSMKDPATYTVVESSLSRLLEYHLKRESFEFGHVCSRDDLEQW